MITQCGRLYRVCAIVLGHVADESTSACLQTTLIDYTVTFLSRGVSYIRS